MGWQIAQLGGHRPVTGPPRYMCGHSSSTRACCRMASWTAWLTTSARSSAWFIQTAFQQASAAFRRAAIGNQSRFCREQVTFAGGVDAFLYREPNTATLSQSYRTAQIRPGRRSCRRHPSPHHYVGKAFAKHFNRKPDRLGRRGAVRHRGALVSGPLDFESHGCPVARADEARRGPYKRANRQGPDATHGAGAGLRGRDGESVGPDYRAALEARAMKR